jgi:hypothetical protein
LLSERETRVGAAMVAIAPGFVFGSTRATRQRIDALRRLIGTTIGTGARPPPTQRLVFVMGQG